MDEECHIEGKRELEAAIAECCEDATSLVFSAHQRVFGSVCACPAACGLLIRTPTFHGPMTCALPAGLARHRSQLGEDVNAGDTAMVRRNDKLTYRRCWTGPGVVAVSPTRTSFWISMRGCLLKCSSEQVRKATDAEWIGAELSGTLATELLNSRQRSGQRGYVNVEPEGQPTEEPPVDTRTDIRQVLGATGFSCSDSGRRRSCEC